MEKRTGPIRIPPRDCRPIAETACRRWTGCAALIAFLAFSGAVGIAIRFTLGLSHLLQTGQLGPFIEADEFNTLSCIIHFAVFRHARTNQHARYGDQRDLRIQIHQRAAIILPLRSEVRPLV